MSKESGIEGRVTEGPVVSEYGYNAESDGQDGGETNLNAQKGEIVRAAKEGYSPAEKISEQFGA